MPGTGSVWRVFVYFTTRGLGPYILLTNLLYIQFYVRLYYIALENNQLGNIVQDRLYFVMFLVSFFGYFRLDN